MSRIWPELAASVIIIASPVAMAIWAENVPKVPWHRTPSTPMGKVLAAAESGSLIGTHADDIPRHLWSPFQPDRSEQWTTAFQWTDERRVVTVKFGDDLVISECAVYGPCATCDEGFGLRKELHWPQKPNHPEE